MAIRTILIVLIALNSPLAFSNQMGSDEDGLPAASECPGSKCLCRGFGWEPYTRCYDNGESTCAGLANPISGVECFFRSSGKGAWSPAKDDEEDGSRSFELRGPSELDGLEEMRERQENLEYGL